MHKEPVQVHSSLPVNLLLNESDVEMQPFHVLAVSKSLYFLYV